MKYANIVMTVLLIVVFSLGVIAPVDAAAQISSDMSEVGLISANLINTDPDPVVAGNIATIRFGLENLGGEMVPNMQVELGESYPFTLVSGEEAVQDIGSISGYQGSYDEDTTKILKYKILVDKYAVAGNYDLTLYYYTKGSVTKFEKTVSIEVTNKESAQVIRIDKSILIPGKEDTLVFTITNVGSAPLSDMTFSWENSDKVILPVGSDNSRYIPYLDIGESEQLVYNVIANTDATAGLYQLDLRLEYDDPSTGSTKEINTIAGVYVGGGTDFDVAFSESSSGTTSFTVANVGSNPATSVSVIIPQQNGWTVTGANSAIIGNLNTGDYTVASFTLSSSSSSAGNMTGMRERNFSGARPTQGMIPPSGQSVPSGTSGNYSQGGYATASNTLKVQIAYTTTMGKRETMEKTVMMSSSSSQTGSISTIANGAAQFRGRQQQNFFSQYKLYLIGFGVLLVVAIWFTVYRRRKIMHSGNMNSIKGIFNDKNKRK